MLKKNKNSQKFGPWHNVVSSYICKHNLIQQPHKFICMKEKNYIIITSKIEFAQFLQIHEHK
jgi:hypothetical protein